MNVKQVEKRGIVAEHMARMGDVFNSYGYSADSINRLNADIEKMVDRATVYIHKVQPKEED